MCDPHYRCDQIQQLELRVTLVRRIGYIFAICACLIWWCCGSPSVAGELKVERKMVTFVGNLEIGDRNILVFPSDTFTVSYVLFDPRRSRVRLIAANYSSGGSSLARIKNENQAQA